MLYMYCSPECCCVIYYLTFVYNDLASRVSKIFVYLVAILTCSINCVYDLVYYRMWYSIPESYEFLIKELWKRNCTSWIDNEQDYAQSNALMDNNGTIAKRRISDKINDKNPNCLKWRLSLEFHEITFIVRRRFYFFVDVQEIELRMSRYPQAYWHFSALPKNSPFRFWLEASLNMLMGTVPTYIGYELLTQNPDNCINVRYTYSTQNALASTIYEGPTHHLKLTQ